MRTVACIVDYHNFFPHRAGGQREQLEHELHRMVASIGAMPDVQRLLIYLYGGWLDEGVLSKDASSLQQDIGAIDPFPVRHPAAAGLLHGKVELALRLAALPELNWHGTLKHIRGLGRLRIEPSSITELCERNAQQCPVLLLRRFTRKRNKRCGVPNCVVTNANAFSRLQQKMVDSMMVCDIVHLAEQDDVASILTFTDDIDVLPGLAMANAKSGKECKVIFRNSRLEESYAPFLDRTGITHETWAPKP